MFTGGSDGEAIRHNENCPSDQELNTVVALFAAGHYSEAEAMATAMTVRFPFFAFGWIVLGEVCKQKGQSAEAWSHMQKAVVLAPGNPDLHFNLGNLLQNLGKFEKAAESYRLALQIKPDYPYAHNNLGITYQRMGRQEDAESSFLQALQIKPDFDEALLNLGVTLKALGRLDEAEACYRRALDISPNFAEAHFNMGVTLQQSYRLTEAEVSYRHALQIKPDFAEAHSNLGNTLKESGRLNEAEICYRQALQINPDSAELHSNLGVLLKDLGRLNEAEACCQQALQIKPDFAGAYNNLGVILKESGLLLEAENSYRRALQINPDYAEAHSNLAITLLTRGDLTAGWEENEWRWSTPQMITGRRNFAQPQWRGEMAEGQTLLIHAEQGYGDTLQFCRYASLAATRGLRVILEVQTPLVRLLRNLPHVDRVVGSGDELPVFDLHCPMLSLPLALKTTLATIPSAQSYLQTDKMQVNAWQIRLADLPGKGHRIGLVWAGNSHSHWPQAAVIDRQRSLPPERLLPLFKLSGFHFFSLQKEGTATPKGFPLTDLMDEMEDFADTAALIANLDLVIAVDTAVAHLAAALGKPVWVLNRFDSCWRWLRGRQDSPWYPSVRLFRQPKSGDWQTVIEKVVEDLTLFAED
jgi:tetratricopeptide (TPR) repeat protein